MPATFAIAGLAELKAELRRLPEELASDAGEVVLGAANRAEAAILARYPHGPTGNLRDGVSVHEARADRFGAKMIVRSAAPHAHLYEYGSASRAYKGANRGRMPAATGGPVFVPEMQRARAWMWDALRRLIEATGLEVRD